MLRRLTMLLVFGFACQAFAQSPCDGKIQDKLPHPMEALGTIPKPAAGQSFVDPQFGTKITRISNALPSETTNAVINALYNSMRGWNADESQIIAWHRGGAKTYEFYQGDTPYAHIGTIVFGSATTLNTAPADIEHIIWDSSDPNVFYYPAADSLSSRAHPMLMKVVLHWPAAPTITLVRDFLAECSAHGVGPGAANSMNVLSLGHGQDMSYDGNRYVGLRCGNPNANSWNFVYSITNNTIIGPGYASAGSADGPPWPCPSGKCFWRQNPGLVFDAAMNQIGATNMAKTLEHSTVGQTKVGGFDFVMQGAYDEVIGTPPIGNSGSLMMWRLDQASSNPIAIVGQANGWPYPPSGSHPSLAAMDGSGWNAVGIVGTGLGTTTLDNEIVLANVNTLQVCRVAHARTCDGHCGGTNWNYWAETHPQISKDGYRILFDSDFYGSNTVDLYVADLRPSAITILTTALPNAVVGEPYHFPFSIAGGAGPPYTCSQPLGTFPAGIHLNGCAADGPSLGPETQNFTIQACDSLGACTPHAYPLTSQERPAITTTSPLPDQIVGMPVTLAPFIAVKGVPPYTFAVVGTPCAGMALNFDGSWTVGPPVTLQVCSFGVKATDSHAQPIAGQANFSLTIKMPPTSGCPCSPTAVSVKIESVP